jgi:hypothetical protein
MLARRAGRSQLNASAMRDMRFPCVLLWQGARPTQNVIPAKAGTHASFNKRFWCG